MLYLIAFLICCLGHAMIWVRAINWTHGIRSQQGWTDVMRLGMHIVLSGLPLLWLISTEFKVPGGILESWPIPWRWLGWGYLILTGIMGLVFFPLLWFKYAWRKEPAGQLSVSSKTHDITRALGKRPVGSGRRGWKAHLPGNQAYSVEFIERELALERLPAAWDGLRILHLSDLHFWGRPARAYFERLLHLCSSKPCDLLVLTGDLVDSDSHYDWLRMLQMIKPKEARLGIRGNHDARYNYELVNAELQAIGFNMLGGRCEVITLRGEPLLVAGNEAPWLLPIPDLSQHQSQDCFRLALIHSPDQFNWAVQNQFDLVLAGHNHGGQIRLPGFGSIFVPGKTGRRYDMGLYHEKMTMLHVSRGVSGGHPIRYFCRPEATWLTLRCQR